MAIARPQTQRAAVTFRDFQPEDFPALVEIWNLTYPEHPTTIEQERFEWGNFDTTKYLRRRYVAVDPSGAVVGEASFSHMPSSHDPERFGMWIGVHPQWRQKGVGTAFYEHLGGQFRALHARMLRTWMRETMTETAAWLARRGFRELMRGWESRLDLGSFDPARFGNHSDPPQRVEIVTLAEELARDSDAIRVLYELDCAISPDEPRIDPFTPPDFAMYRDWVLNSPGSMPEAIFIAKDGDRYVGLTELFRNEALPDTLQTGFTGIRREYRGRGIALALKLRALRWAKPRGYREVRTWNSTLNAPMLGINVRLGFVKQPAWITFGKDLASGALG